MLWNVDANPGITGPPSAESNTMPTLPRNTSARDRPLEDRRTVQVEGKSHARDSDVPSIGSNKHSSVEPSGEKYVIKVCTSVNTMPRNTIKYNTTKTS